MDSIPAIDSVLDLVVQLRRRPRVSLSRLPCSNQNRVMSIRPAGLAACQRQTAPTNVLWMSSGSAPTVLARMSLGQDVALLLQVRVLPLGVVVARARRRTRTWPRCPRRCVVHPVSRRQRRQRGDSRPAAGGGRHRLLIWSSQSTGGSVPWRRRTASGNGFCGEADRPLDEVVLELDADLAQVRRRASDRHRPR